MFDKAENRCPDARFVLSNYRRWLDLDKIQDQSWQFLGAAGGYSGAMFWKLTGQHQTYCLRRWPSSDATYSGRLLSIHRLLKGIHEIGGRFIPVPLPSCSASTLVWFGGAYWQLEPWMPGEADYWRAPNNQKLASAMGTLADFHRMAVAASPGGVSKNFSGAIQERRRLLNRFVAKGRPQQAFDFLRSSAAIHSDVELQKLASVICAQFLQFASQIELELNQASQMPTRCQPVISDVWHDHVLFTENQVTGLVDFGQIREDSPAMDVARLLGSLVGDDAKGWKMGLEKYLNRFDLPDSEKELVRIFDRSTTLLSGINWLQWICVENRDFGDINLVLPRLRKISERMSHF